MEPGGQSKSSKPGWESHDIARHSTWLALVGGAAHAAPPAPGYCHINDLLADFPILSGQIPE